VFVNASADELKRTAEIAGLDVIQLHGDESPEFAKSLELPVWKVLHLDRLPKGWEDFPAERYLIDSGTVDIPGGTGIQVDSARAREFVLKSKLPVMLAGGLKASTVGDAIKVVQPAGVDVASGVEQSPGKKNMQAVRDFIRNAREASLTL
jgi:phosphoribosylanthranilate isomerase